MAARRPVRAADSGATGAAYLTLANGDTVDIAITGWSSSAAVAAELHETMQHQGMVHMSARPAIVIARDSTLTMIPGELPEDLDEATIEALHQVLFNVHILEGELVCPDTGRKFPIKQGIPNMILHEDEI